MVGESPFWSLCIIPGFGVFVVMPTTTGEVIRPGDIEGLRGLFALGVVVV